MAIIYKPIAPKALAKYFEAKLSAEVGPHTLNRLIKDGTKHKVTVLDVRSPEDFAVEHIPTAVNMTLEQLEKGWKGLSKKSRVIAYCYSITCSLAPKAALFLARKGYQVSELSGGIEHWKNAGLPVEKKTSAKDPEVITA